MSADFLAAKLHQRKTANALRKLTVETNGIDFYSNDYLGFARSESLQARIEEECAKFPYPLHGSTGSRLISGNHSILEEVEAELADFHRAESALIFNSGYDANVGLLSCLGQKDHVFLHDAHIHASMIDGMRLSFAARHSFPHNDLAKLQEKLERFQDKTTFVLVESIYSMEGDAAPIEELAKLCTQYNAHLIVDEAHALGLFGTSGQGRVQQLQLEEKVFARVYTFGKALGIHGAAVLGSNTLKEYLVNYARSFIYTTGTSPHTALVIKCAYKELQESKIQLDKVSNVNKYFKNALSKEPWSSIPGEACIHSIIIPTNDKVKQVAGHLQKMNILVKAIMAPTVKSGEERLRLCIHEFNTQEEIDLLISGISASL